MVKCDLLNESVVVGFKIHNKTVVSYVRVEEFIMHYKHFFNIHSEGKKVLHVHFFLHFPTYYALNRACNSTLRPEVKKIIILLLCHNDGCEMKNIKVFFKLWMDFNVEMMREINLVVT